MDVVIEHTEITCSKLTTNTFLHKLSRFTLIRVKLSTADNVNVASSVCHANAKIQMMQKTDSSSKIQASASPVPA